MPYSLTLSRARFPAFTLGGFSRLPDGGGSQPVTSVFCHPFQALLVPINVFIANVAFALCGRYRTRTYDLIDVNDAL